MAMRGDLAVEFGQGDVTGHAQVGASEERSAESRTGVAFWYNLIA